MSLLPARSRGTVLVSWAVWLSAAALLVPFAAIWFGGRVLPLSDMRGLHLPIRALYSQALRAGDSVLWTPAIFSGTYIHGEGQGGFFYPLRWLTYRWLPLQSAFNLELLLNYVIVFAGTVVLLRRLLPVSLSSAAFGAMSFAFGGFMLLHVSHLNMVGVLAFMPWMIWLTDVILAETNGRTRLWAALALALVVASQWLVGFPQAMYFSLLGTAPVALYRMVTGRRMAPIAIWAGALALGTAIAAVQILPTLDIAEQSYRARPGPGFTMMYSLHPVNVLQLWSPYSWPSRVYTVDEPPIIHEFALYTGAFCTVALLWLAVRLRALDRAARQLALAALALGTLALVMAFGRFGWLGPLLVQVPVLSVFRAPARHIVLVHLAMAVLAAITFEDLLAIRQGTRAAPRRLLWVLALPPLAAACVVWAINGGSGWVPSVDGAAPLRVAALAIVPIAIICVLFFAVARQWPLALPVLVLAAAGDLAYSGLSFALSDPPTTLDRLVTEPLPPAAAGSYIWRPPEIVDGDLPAMYGYRLADGYLALSPRRWLDPASTPALRIAGVAWRRDPEGWTRVPNPLPRARLVAETAVMPRRLVRRTLPRLDVNRTAIVEADVPGLQGPPGAAVLLTDRPGLIVVETTAAGRQLLVLTERFHEGWRALRGCESAPVRLYGELIGCIVPAGRHTVELRFEPRSFTRGARISLAALLLLACAAAAGVRATDGRGRRPRMNKDAQETTGRSASFV
jgi:hypothetical protein